ncbi:lipopolysaccharide biosynthesis protein [Sphingobium subterraneum]|uniref:O-antigen/teichoic acid export membrane protein n=1 Tax=Sphingobium subterraneum TaxID=627688 RepID=A0A841J0R5_9SPHN|nr:lipopolysaccharide biosynthesis protein [Sphingobium subterraneum]MBB6123932.1 O-antigen/teichoic acid export membrane protein [Sphingobium subterraneum]
MGLEDADATDAGFGTKVRSALFWRSGGQIIAQMVSWTSTIYVMRALDPGDYGLFAMTQVILSFMQFLNGYGLVSALVQAESLSTHQVRQALGIMLLLNAVLAAVQLAAAPLAADYYHQPMVADLLRVQALIYLSTPFTAIPEVLMGRSLDFRRPAIVGLIAALAAAGVAVAGAILGWGVWTLVFAPIVGFYVRGIGYAFATGFVPFPSFDFRGAGWMVTFGVSLLGGQLLWIIQNQADIFIGGRVLPAHELGLYSEALFLTQIFVSKFIPPLNDVAFPAYARMQKDPTRLAASFRRGVRILMLISCPLYFGMAAAAGPIVETLLGAKWLPMADYVRILALAMPFMTVQVMFAPLSNALGRPGTTARIYGVGAIIMPVAFLIGIRWGATGLALAWLAGFPLLTFATIRIAGKPAGIGVADMVRESAPAVCASAVMALIVTAVEVLLLPAALPAPLRLAVLVAVGGVSYLLPLWIFARPMLGELFALARRQPAAADA